MNESINKAESQLMAIEQIHGVKFLNREEVATRIGEVVSDERQILVMCTFINLWVSGNKLRGEVAIPEELVATILELEGRQRTSYSRGNGKGERRPAKKETLR
ncbi:MAG TPA: hypothetical protein VLY86_04730 [Methanothrix sp.]|nr:hypothetical protein [Methanothrix sp.]